MLTLFARHGLFDLDLDAKGDIEVDFHHTVEDAGITLGQAVGKALGEKKGIRRYGFAYVPMDEALVRAVIDFLRAIAVSAAINLHVEILAGRDAHHMAEGVFKALARALDAATQIDPRVEGVPSTKGVL
jgi:imidazoleglycerol-phosphate dehydratase